MTGDTRQNPNVRPPRGPAARPPRPDRPPRPGERPDRREHTPWRERMPELVAGVGATLVIVAIAGFLSSTWDDITQIHKAMVLAAAAAGLTVAGVWADRQERFESVIGTAWATATVLVAAAVTLGASTTWPGVGRVTIAAGGAAGALHAGLLLARRPESVVQQTSLFLALVYAVGPFGTALSNRFEWYDLVHAGTPLVGLVDPTITSDHFLLTGIGHLVLGVAWLVLAHLLAGRAAGVAKTLGTITVGFAALELNVLVSPVGAVAALAVVLGYLLYGLWREDTALVVTGSVGILIAGVRVLGAVFSGQVTVTLLVFAGGLGLLGWAFQQMRRRHAEEDAR